MIGQAGLALVRFPLLPAGSPAPIAEIFNAALIKALSSDKVRDQIIKIGAPEKLDAGEIAPARRGRHRARQQ